MTDTVGAALRSASSSLVQAGVASAPGDVRRLMAAALGIGADRLALVYGETMGSDASARFDAMVADRAAFRPVAQIVGERLFWGRPFHVTGDVLDPRPETETLVAAAIDGPEPASILDIGTGSGAILVSLLAEWPRARGTGTDISAAALEVAGKNARRHGVADRCSLVETDWAHDVRETFDLIVCNPPYIAAEMHARLAPDVRVWEPRRALTPGPTGLEAYATIASDISRLLAPNARALFEIGADQGEMVPAIFRSAGWAIAGVLRDMDGRHRVVVAFRPGTIGEHTA